MTQMRQGNLRAERVDFPYFNSRGGRFAKLQISVILSVMPKGVEHILTPYFES